MTLTTLIVFSIIFSYHVALGRIVIGIDPDIPLPHTVYALNQHPHHRLSNLSRSESWVDHRRRMRSLATLPAEIVPLYPGYGTHFVYIYVGTPPQRQSVIVDTGSHFTAFPCTGCSQCGQHTDPYFDVRNSSSATVPNCKGQCVISQSYSEGSSWRAYKVIDKVYIGGVMRALVTSASTYSVDFTFGCQTFETGTSLNLHTQLSIKVFKVCFELNWRMGLWDSR